MQIISIISTLILVFLIVMNYQDTAGVTILSSKIAQILNVTPQTLTLNMALYTLIIFILGELSAIFFFAPIYTSLKEKFKAYKRELEKGSISNTSAEAKIQVLENKITVLEKALDDALKNNNNNNDNQ